MDNRGGCERRCHSILRPSTSLRARTCLRGAAQCRAPKVLCLSLSKPARY